MKIKIVGWSGLNQSYSIIAETYTKSIMNIPGVSLYFSDYEYYNKKWVKQRTTIFDKMPKPEENEIYDITIRFIYPYNLIPDPKSLHTLVFMTCEFNCVTDYIDTYDICDNVWIMTPSEYSKKGIINSGIDENKIMVVNHCYDYVESPMTKEQLRAKYNIPKNDYVYYHNSAMTSNKNVISIIECFETVYRENKNITLFLKGLDNTYGSKNKLIEMIQYMKTMMQITCENKIFYIGDDVSDKEICEYYKLSDCYVSPFFAEGFNLPVLEALCHGLQVICTQGGPPDEFARDAHFIKSTKIKTDDIISVNGNDVQKIYLCPNKMDLLKYMILIPIVKNNINKEYYIEKYSSKTIGKIFYDVLKHVMIHEYETPSVIVLDTIHVNDLIQNILYFCDNIRINIGIFDEIKYVKKYENTNTINIPQNMRENKSQVIDFMIDTIGSRHSIYIDEKVILFADPRNIYKHEMGMSNKYYYRNNELVMMCVDKNNKIHRDDKMIESILCEKLENKMICKKDNKKILYVMNNENGIYSKVPFMINTTQHNPEILYKRQSEDELTIVKLLQQSDVAVITKNVIDKYQKIFRNAPLTILFDEKNQEIRDEDCKELMKSNIFVYNESLQFFFATIYPHINKKFNLLTTKCEFIESGKYKDYDQHKLIINCSYV